MKPKRGKTREISEKGCRNEFLESVFYRFPRVDLVARTIFVPICVRVSLLRREISRLPTRIFVPKSAYSPSGNAKVLMCSHLH